MLLLQILAGLSLVLHGTNSYAFAVHQRVNDFSNYADIIKTLRDYEAKLQAEKRKQDSQMQNIKVDDVYNQDRDINLAAVADGPQKTEKIADSGGSEGIGPEEEVPTTSASTTTTATNHDPMPPAAQKAKEEIVIKKNDLYFAVAVTACSVAGFVGLIMAGVCWYKVTNSLDPEETPHYAASHQDPNCLQRLHRRVKAASDVEYPAYGVTGPTKERLPSPGDRKLAQSAQMYHYQHQKQQMIALEKANGEMKQDGSEEESEEENEEGDYTVYECPGLAPTGEMEVRNPLFTEDTQTPVNGQGPAVNGVPDEGTDTQE